MALKTSTLETFYINEVVKPYIETSIEKNEPYLRSKSKKIFLALKELKKILNIKPELAKDILDISYMAHDDYHSEEGKSIILYNYFVTLVDSLYFYNTNLKIGKSSSWKLKTNDENYSPTRDMFNKQKLTVLPLYFYPRTNSQFRTSIKYDTANLFEDKEELINLIFFNFNNFSDIDPMERDFSNGLLLKPFKDVWNNVVRKNRKEIYIYKKHTNRYYLDLMKINDTDLLDLIYFTVKNINYISLIFKSNGIGKMYYRSVRDYELGNRTDEEIKDFFNYLHANTARITYYKKIKSLVKFHLKLDYEFKHDPNKELEKYFLKNYPEGYNAHIEEVKREEVINAINNL